MRVWQVGLEGGGGHEAGTVHVTTCCAVGLVLSLRPVGARAVPESGRPSVPAGPRPGHCAADPHGPAAPPGASRCPDGSWARAPPACVPVSAAGPARAPGWALRPAGQLRGPLLCPELGHSESSSEFVTSSNQLGEKQQRVREQLERLQDAQRQMEGTDVTSSVHSSTQARGGRRSRPHGQKEAEPPTFGDSSQVPQSRGARAPAHRADPSLQPTLLGTLRLPDPLRRPSLGPTLGV